MTLREILFIAFRFYAISFAAQIIPELPLIFSLIWQSHGQALTEPFGMESLVSLFCYLLMAGALWLASRRLAFSIAREYNPEIRFNLALEDCLIFAFVLLGLYFVLNSIGTVVVRFIHLVAISDAAAAGSEELRTRAEFELVGPSITLIFGLGSILGSRKWAKRVAVGNPRPGSSIR